MTTQEIANRLVNLCREGKYEQVYAELFSPEIESKEPVANGEWETSKGFDGLKEKAAKWHDMVEEMKDGKISDPQVAGDFFSCSWESQVKYKGTEDFVPMDEIAVYQVKDGKVILEQFFYPVPEQ